MIYQTLNVTDLVAQSDLLSARLDKGPVVVLDHDQPASVMIKWEDLKTKVGPSTMQFLDIGTHEQVYGQAYIKK